MAETEPMGTSLSQPTVSVIVPCRDEERYIEQCLDSIIATTYPRDRLEVFVVDGRSRDRTRELVAAYTERHDWIHLLDNPRRTASTALNIGIRRATGDLVVRMDAHAIYPPDYLSRLAAALQETGADNVGGCLITLPSGTSATARAIAHAVSHPLGVGNAHFRIGTRQRRWVDTVPFGCYRRTVFGHIGMFDEELVRNQDDEFNFRLARHGGRVLLDPAIVVRYYARATLRQLGRMYYQYGYFKPLVARKVGRVMTVRQIVPPAFVASMGTGAAAAVAEPAIAPLFAIALGGYFTALITAGLRAAPSAGPRFLVALLAAFVTLHASYGFGFLRGLWDLAVGRRHGAVSRPADVALSRD